MDRGQHRLDFSTETKPTYQNKTSPKNNTQIATRFDVYSKPEFYCRSTKLLYTTDYEDIFIFYEHGFDMNTGKPYGTNIQTFDNEKILKIKSKDISKQTNNNKNTTITIIIVLSMNNAPRNANGLVYE